MEKIPIMKIGNCLLVSLQVDVDDNLAMELQDDLTARIVKNHASGVIIELSTIEMIDSFIGRMLGSITAISRLLGAETVVVGMRPSVAITLVELGLPLEGIRTALNVEKGLEMLRASQGAEGRDGRRPI